jgi:N-acetylneuraminic acid mutarotase
MSRGKLLFRMPSLVRLGFLVSLGAALGCDGSAGTTMPVADGGSDDHPTGGEDRPRGGDDRPMGATDTLPEPPPPPPGRWETLPSMPGIPRRYGGVAAVGERVFVVGGLGVEAREVTAFNTRTGAWEMIEPLPKAVPMANVAGVGGRLFVLGGADQRSIEVRETFAYDVASGTWSPRAPVPVEKGRGVAAVGVHGTRILIAGGIIPGQSANNLQTGIRVREFLAYDTAKDTWESLPDLALPRGYASGAVVGDVFWVIGGSTDFVRTDQVDAFDLVAGKWTDRPPPPQTLSSAPIAVFGGRIYVMGGIATGSGMIGGETQVLEPSTGRWTNVTPMKTPRFATGAATIGDRIYVPTGVAMVPPSTVAAVPTLEVFLPTAP